MDYITGPARSQPDGAIQVFQAVGAWGLVTNDRITERLGMKRKEVSL
jgi:hypothetical protein